MIKHHGNEPNDRGRWGVNVLRTMKRLLFMEESVHCLSKAREVQEKPGMNTTAGLEESPVDSAQICVPSAEVT